MRPLPERDRVVTRAVIERHAATRPDADCARGVAEIWSWARAREAMYRSGNALASRDVRRGDHVLIFLPNGLDYLRAWWGVSALGAVMVPVNTAYRGATLRHVVADSGARVIITGGELVGRLDALDPALGTALDVVDPAELAAGADEPPPCDPPHELWDVHTINFTSGTTGPAKGVRTPYLQSYMGGFDAMGEGGGLTTDDCWLIDAPLFHVGAQMSAQAAMSVGAAIAVREQFAGARYWEVARETGATHCLLIGTMANFLLTREPSPAEREHRLRVATIAPMVEDPRGFRERYGIKELCSVYGQTEVSLPLLVPPGGELVAGSLGRPRPGVQVRLVDEHDVTVPVGEVGELVVRTDRPWEMNVGYHNRDDATVAAWRNGWFHTGDAFRRDAGDNFYFVDRTRDALRRRGENVSSFQVETEVLAHPDVLEAACVAAPAELGEDEVKVFVVPVDRRTVDPRALVEFLVPRLPHFMVPRFVEVVDELPKTQTMRVQKFELRQRGNGSGTWDRQAAGIRVTRRGIEEC